MVAKSDDQYVIVDFPARQLTYTGFRWSLEGDQLAEAIDLVYRDICQRNGWTLLWDFQAVGRLVLEPGDIDRYVRKVEAKTTPDCKPSKVILVTRDLMIRSLARLYQHLSKLRQHPVELAGTLVEASIISQSPNLPTVIRERVYGKT